MSGISSVHQLVPYVIMAAKVIGVLVAVVLLVLWRGAVFARKRAYGPGGGRK